MKKFTYNDYMKYQQYMENITYFQNVLKEDSEVYGYSKINIHHKHDKIFREILEEKKEVVTFINRTLKIENKKQALREEDIEKYNRKFITSNFRYAETDVIYRKKGENIFFLIEHQSTVDYSMPYRILMYSLEIMKSVIDENMLKKKGYKLPMVYPIILYTGTKKWNVEKYIEERQQKIPGCEPVKFYEYNIVDINKYSEDELLESEMFLPKLMLLEKSKDSQKIIQNLNKLIGKKLTEKNKNFLKRIIYHIFRDEIGEKETEKLLEKLKIERGGENMVEELLRKGFMEEFERLKKLEKRKAREEGKREGREEGKREGREEGKREGREEGKREGREEGKREGIEQGKKEGIKIVEQDMKLQWIEKMLKSNINEKDILKITEISKEELKEIKRKIEEKAI